MWLGMPVKDELAWVDSINRARDKGRSAAHSWSVQQLSQAARIARSAPWLKPGVLLGLGKASSSMEPVEMAASLGVMSDIRRNPTNNRAGAQVRGANLTPGHRKRFEEQQYRQASFNAARQYVGGQMQRGAEARGLKELRDQGLLGEGGQLRSPVPVEALEEYRKDPGEYARRRPREAPRIQRFLDLTRGLSGLREPSPYGGPLPRNDWREVEFESSEGRGAYHPVSGVFYRPEEGVRGENILDPSGIAAFARRGSIGGVGAGEPLGRLASPAVQGLEEGLEGVRIPQLRIPGAGETPVEATRTAGFESPADVVQASFMGLQAPAQEVQGFIRNVYGATHGRDVAWWQPQSDALIALSGADPGEGLLTADPDSEVAKERRRREEQRGLINGQIVTAGRWIASATPVEPGSDAYRVVSGLFDAGIQLVADPTIIAAGRLANISKARTMFAGGDEIAEATGALRAAVKPGFIRPAKEEAGIVEGLFTNNVHGPTANAWMIGKGSGVVEKLREMSSPYEIWLFTNRKMLPDEATAVANATDTAAVRDALRPMLGTKYRTTRDVWNNPIAFGKLSRRGLAMVPHSIDPMDPMSWMTQTERWMRATKMDDARQVEFMDRMARGRTKNERFSVLEDIMADRQGVLADAGFESPELRREMVRLFKDTQNDEQLWFIDEMGDNKSVWHDVAVGDDVVAGVGPHLSVEHIGREIPLPNTKEIRALANKWPNLTKMTGAKTPLEWPTALLDSFQNDIWKPFTLLRAAWPMRVIGEEQLRMGGAGLHSMFSGHPISAVAWAIGPNSGARVTGKIEQAIAKIPGIEPRGGISGTGEAFEDAAGFEKAMASRNRAGGFLDEKPGRVRTNKWRVYKKGEADYSRARAEELALLRHSPEAVKLTDSTLDDTLEWFTNGEGRPVFDEMVDAHPALAEPLAARRYLETVAERINIKTGGDEELLDAIRSGKFRGENWLDEGIRPTREFREGLEELVDSGPDAVKGHDYAYIKSTEGGTVARGWRRGVDWAFAGLMSSPTNYLSRSPAFRQFYWRRAPELIAHGDEAAKTELIANARKANLPKRTIDNMERTTAKGSLNAEEIDVLARGYGLDETKNLLYDLSEKSLIAEQMRLVAPFGEAWREVITRWNKLGPNINLTAGIEQRARGVKNLRRFQQAILGARGEDFGEAIDVPKIWDPEEEKWTQPGFFWRDEFDEEVFIMPGSQWLTGAMTDAMPGVPRIEVPLTGRVQGLNMIGQIFPGVGPVAAIPTSLILADKPDWRRQARELLLPFGSPLDEGGATGWAAALDPRNYMPPWMKTGFQALINGGFDQQTNRLWANAEKSAANYLYSTGNYDTSTKGGKQKLLDDAKQAARGLYFVKALVGFGAPTAPSMKFLTETNQGLVRLAMLRDDYYKMLSEDPTTADEEFISRWGDLNAEPGKDKVGMSMQAFTREIQGGVGVSKEWGDWADSSEGKALKQKYPDTWAFYGPASGEFKFDYDTYLRSLQAGDRETLTLEEWYDLGQQHLGRMQLDRAEAEIAATPGDEDEDARWLADVETWVYENYPGYRTSGETPQTEKRAAREDIFRELTDAYEDKHSPMSEALKGYWNERLASVDYASGLGTLRVNGPWYDLSRSKALVDDRAYLYELGQYWAGQDEGFKVIWNRHLRAEVEPSPEDLVEEGS